MSNLVGDPRVDVEAEVAAAPSVAAATPTLRRNTLRTYLKTGIVSLVLGVPIAAVGQSFASLVGISVGWGIAVWIAGRIFGLKGKGPRVLVYVATVAIVDLVTFASLILLAGPFPQGA